MIEMETYSDLVCYANPWWRMGCLASFVCNGCLLVLRTFSWFVRSLLKIAQSGPNSPQLAWSNQPWNRFDHQSPQWSGAIHVTSCFVWLPCRRFLLHFLVASLSMSRTCFVGRLGGWRNECTTLHWWNYSRQNRLVIPWTWKPTNSDNRAQLGLSPQTDVLSTKTIVPMNTSDDDVPKFNC